MCEQCLPAHSPARSSDLDSKTFALTEDCCSGPVKMAAGFGQNICLAILHLFL